MDITIQRGIMILFMGGAHKMCVNGVTVMHTMVKHQLYFSALAKFDCMMDAINGIIWCKSENAIICDLIDCIINKQDEFDIDKYIIDSFALFTNNKMHISLDYSELLWRLESEVVNKIMYTLDTNIGHGMQSADNMFRWDVIFKLFSNLQSIEIRTCSFPYLNDPDEGQLPLIIDDIAEAAHGTIYIEYGFGYVKFIIKKIQSNDKND